MAATLKLNIANPSTGAQIKLELEDEKQKRIFSEKRISNEIEGDGLGDAWKGFIFKIMGGNDKEGFPMMQGVLQPKRVRLLLNKDHKCYRSRRTGERKRKSIRGCIVGPDISVLHLVVVKQGPEGFPGLTDKVIPRRLGPKRASKIRKLFNLQKADDVRQFVIRREVAKKDGKKKQFKAPKIQRLVTPAVLQRKRHRLSLKKRASAKAKSEKADYLKLLAQRNKQKRQSLVSKKRSESTKGTSVKEVTTPAKGATKAVAKVAAKAGAKVAAKAGAKVATKAGAKVAAKAGAKTAAPSKASAKPATTKAATTKAVTKTAAKTTTAKAPASAGKGAAKSAAGKGKKA